MSQNPSKSKRSILIWVCGALLAVLAGLALLFFVTGQGRAQLGLDRLYAYLPYVVKQFIPTEFRKGPDVLYTGKNTEMKIVWQLDATTPAALEWGADTSYSSGSATTSEYNTDHQHAYIITGLAPGTKVDYRLRVGSSYSAGSFYTAPAADATQLKFFAYGDTRDGASVQNSIDGQILSSYSADPAFQTFILDTGDIVSNGDSELVWTSQFFDPKYKNIRAVLANLSFLPAMGNHEGSGVLFVKYFPMPFVADRYGSFDYGPAHVVMLDQYVPYNAGSAQYQWLEKDLASSTKTWKFIVLHEPGWSAGGGHPNNATVQKDIQPLAVKYGVSIVFGGHNHYYARAVVDGVQYLTLGGGGAPLYKPNTGAEHVVKTSQTYHYARIVIDGNKLTATILKPDGTVIETFEVVR